MQEMKITVLAVENDGQRSAEIRSEELSFRALLRSIKKIPDAIIIDSAHDPMNDNARIEISYRGIPFNIDTPFSDYLVTSNGPGEIFDGFIVELRNYKVRWWDRFI